MASAYRCSLGHTWEPTSTDGPVALCPVCGDTAISCDGTDVTLAYVPRPADPSFSSLTGMPGGSSLSQVEFSPTPEPTDPPTLEFAVPTVPGYEILGEIGRGGMGVVYRARQLSLNRTVALKMILSGAHAGPAERDRFRREAKAAAALQHSHIVQIFEVGEANGHPYLVLEFVDGGSLAQHLAAAPMPTRDAAALVELLARAMQYAHESGIVHRDLKPGNILLNATRGQRTEDKGQKSDTPGSGLSSGLGLLSSRPLSSVHCPLVPKVTDFGLAKQIDEAVGADGGTRTGAVMGTPSYIAPEQASGKVHDVGPPADVYALGAILYECLTGRPPFRGQTALDTVLQVLHDDPVPPKRLQSSVPRDLETICLKCLVKNPAKRYASSLALAEDLRRFLDGEPIKARPLSAWGRSVKWAKRHPALSVLGVATVVATVGLVTVLSLAYARVTDAVEQKEIEAKNAQLERVRAEGETRRAEQLAREISAAKNTSDERARSLERSAFALRLSQVAALCERDPRRAARMLDDDDICPPRLRDFTWAYLRRLCDREERTYAGQGKGDPLHAVAHSAFGAYTATAGGDGVVHVWDAKSGRVFGHLIGSGGPVHALAISPDGATVAAACGDGAVRLWDIPVDILDIARGTLRLLQPFLPPNRTRADIPPAVTLAKAHPGGAACVAFAPDGRTLASGGADGMIQFWNLSGWHLSVPNAALAGGAAAVAARDAAVRESPTGRRVWPARVLLEAHAGGVLCLAFSEAHRMLASGGMDRTVKVWSADGAKSVRVLRHFTAVPAVTFTPDASMLVTANNSDPPTIRLIDTDTWEDTRRLTGHTEPVLALAVSHDGAMLASAGADRSVRLWDTEDGRERGLLFGHGQWVRGLAFGSDRRTVVSAGMDGIARVWRTTPRAHEAIDVTDPFPGVGRPLRVFIPDRSERVLTAAAVGGNGSMLVLGEASGPPSVWLGDMIPARGVPTPPGLLMLWRLPIDPPRGAAQATAVTPDGRVAVAAVDNALYVWRGNWLGVRGTPGQRVPLMPAKPRVIRTPRPVTAMTYDPRGEVLATIDAGGVRVWTVPDLASAHELPAAVPSVEVVSAPDARAVAFDPMSDRLVVAVGRGLRVVTRTGKPVVFRANAHAAPIDAVAIDPTGTTLATGDTQGRVKLWALSADGVGELPRATTESHTGAVASLAFSPDGRTLASGGADRAVILWDPETGQERAVLTEHFDKLLRVHFTPDGGSLFTISRDGVVRRWRANAVRTPAGYEFPPPPKRDFPPPRP